jgi:hypothetical protein
MNRVEINACVIPNPCFVKDLIGKLCRLRPTKHPCMSPPTLACRGPYCEHLAVSLLTEKRDLSQSELPPTNDIKRWKEKEVVFPLSGAFRNPWVQPDSDRARRNENGVETLQKPV